MKHLQLKNSLSFCLSLGAIFVVLKAEANGPEIASPKSWRSQLQDSPLDESFRLTLNLGQPKRFATRFLKHNRTFQIRIFPAASKDISESQFYDTRYVKRVLIEEKDGEVTLSLQLKNVRMGWLATTQNDPWRILLDFWSLDAKKTGPLEEEWNWQTGENSHSSNTSKSNSTDHIGLKDRDSEYIQQASGLNTNPDSNTNNLSGQQQNLQSVDLKTQNKSELGKFVKHDILIPLERSFNLQPKRLKQLQEKVGENSGSENEFDSLNELAQENYKQGRYPEALQVFRRMSALNDRKFKESDIILWQSGESAFLTEKSDSSKDYFRGLIFLFPQSPLSSQAKLRLLDLELIEDSTQKGSSVVSDSLQEKYSLIANSSAATSAAQIAASVRNTLETIDKNPAAAKMFQQNFNTCVTFDRIPIDTQQSCAYILTRSAIEEQDLLSAESSISKFKSRFPNDTRILSMQNILQGRVQNLLNESIKSSSWENWIAFEKKVRPEVLNFTLANPSYILERAHAFSKFGDLKRAATLYTVAQASLPDNSQRNECFGEIAKIASINKETKKTNIFLNRIRQSSSRQSEGMTSKTVDSVKELALSPNNNSLALEILLDEMKFGRYSENNLNVLTQFAKIVRKKPSAETIAQKILQYPAKSQAETDAVEKSLLQFAADLTDQNRLPRSAEIYMAVANMSQSNKKAESAYKAGVNFARAGLFEKAKESWQTAASDLNDKRFSTLANERLERLR